MLAAIKFGPRQMTRELGANEPHILLATLRRATLQPLCCAVWIQAGGAAPSAKRFRQDVRGETLPQLQAQALAPAADVPIKKSSLPMAAAPKEECPSSTSPPSQPLATSSEERNNNNSGGEGQR